MVCSCALTIFSGADEATLLLIEHLCRRLKNARLLIVASYRDTDLDINRPLGRALEQLTRQGIAQQRIDVKRLDVAGVRQMLAGLGRPEPPPPLVGAVYTKPKEIRSSPGGFQIPGRRGAPVRTWWRVARRPERRPHRCTAERPVRDWTASGALDHRVSRGARPVAIFGRTLDYAVLSAIALAPDDRLLEVLEEAEGAQVLVSDDRGSLTFGHELIRQTLLASMTALRRQRLHLRAAEAIEQSYASTLDAHLAEIAGHYRLAGAAAHPAKYCDYSSRAGDRALEVRAFDESIRLFGEALAVLSASGYSVSDDRLADLHRKCGQAYTSLI